MPATVTRRRWPGDSVSQVDGLFVVEENVNPDESTADYLSRVWATLPKSKPVIIHSKIGVRAQAQLLLAYKANDKSGMALRLSYDTKTVSTKYRFFDGQWTTV